MTLIGLYTYKKVKSVTKNLYEDFIRDSQVFIQNWFPFFHCLVSFSLSRMTHKPYNGQQDFWLVSSSDKFTDKLHFQLILINYSHSNEQMQTFICHRILSVSSFVHPTASLTVWNGSKKKKKKNSKKEILIYIFEVTFISSKAIQWNWFRFVVCVVGFFFMIFQQRLLNKMFYIFCLFFCFFSRKKYSKFYLILILNNKLTKLNIN